MVEGYKSVKYEDESREMTHEESRALTAFFMSHYPTFVSFARNYISDSALCEDIVQEAFVAFIEQRRTQWRESSVKSFIYNTIRNRALNILRHHVVRDKYASSAIEQYDAHKQSEDFFTDAIIKEEASMVIINAVDQLPDISRRIMGMAIDGMSNAEIAQQLGVSINTIRTHKFRSYKILRQLLSHLRLL